MVLFPEIPPAKRGSNLLLPIFSRLQYASRRANNSASINWFKNGEETPVDAPSIRLREIWIDKERGLMVRRLDAGRTSTAPEASAAKIAEQFFEDVLRSCFGIG